MTLTTPLRPLGAALALALGGLCAAGAQAYTIDFDSLAPGSLANSDPVAIANGVRFDTGVLLPDLDSDGYEILDPQTNQPIPGFEHWAIDTAAPDLRVGSPTDHLSGPAPSGPNALDAFFAPPLVSFSAPQTLTGFGIEMDHSSFGFPGFVAIDFLDAAGKSVYSYSYIQAGTQSLDLNFATPVTASAFILSSGKYYDNISIQVSAVPEPNGLLLGAAGLIGIAAIRLRRDKRDDS